MRAKRSAKNVVHKIFVFLYIVILVGFDIFVIFYSINVKSLRSIAFCLFKYRYAPIFLIGAFSMSFVIKKSLIPPPSRDTKRLVSNAPDLFSIMLIYNSYLLSG